MLQLTLTLKVTTTKVVETRVTVNHRTIFTQLIMLHQLMIDLPDKIFPLHIAIAAIVLTLI